ncbi:lachesin [Eurytemora carolleeae]|uniref:lachesin n=1 Tax=Eurytemora carolleeae TaxID=1294199 RepID=UPI000C757A0E|nr:lachesin [Eurytemora carolleeae]|eukprot:XP_023338060.1 lachesin-like [Eurytemora affinis]
MTSFRFPGRELILLIFILREGESDGKGGSWRSGSDLSKLYDSVTPNPTGSLSGPYFLQETGTTVTGIIGKTTFLVCTIRNLSNYTVSWVRHSDTHLLATGGYTYTPDTRFTSVHKPSSENWVLEIRDTNTSDAGIYECQISTNPVRSLQFQLNISDSLTEIWGSKERHIDKGSPFNLTCRVSSYQQSIPYILWYHNNQQINLAESDTFKASGMRMGGEDYSMSLLVSSAERKHSGKYHCISPAGQSSTISLHVHTEENAAELYLNSGLQITGPSTFILILGYFYMFF